jgi:hypothetical protein
MTTHTGSDRDPRSFSAEDDTPTVVTCPACGCRISLPDGKGAAEPPHGEACGTPEQP